MLCRWEVHVPASTGLAVRRVECFPEDGMDISSGCVDARIYAGCSNKQNVLPTTNFRHPIHQDFFESDRIDEY